MKNIFQLALLVIVCFSGTTFAQFKGKILVKGLENPESVAVSRQGGIFVSSLGKIGQDGDGAILEIKKGKAEVFAANLDDPKGITFYQDTLYVNDKNRVWKINKKGQAKIAVPTKDFPHPPIALNDVVADPETGTLYVADSGDQGKSGAVYRISPKGKVTTVIHDDKMPELNRPNGLAMDGQSFILLTDSGTGILYRIRVKDGKAERVAGGFGHADGLAWDLHGQLFITDWKGGRVFGIHRPGDKAKLLPVRFNSAADLCFDQEKKRLLIPDMRAGTLTALPASIPGAVVDTRPLPYKTMFAFPKIKWTGWEPLDEQGKVVSLRPLVLTHAGDGSNRVFVAMQRGVIHVFPNDSEVKKTKVF